MTNTENSAEIGEMFLKRKKLRQMLACVSTAA